MPNHIEKAKFNTQLRHVLIKDSKAFDLVYDQMRNAYTRAWDKQSQKAFQDALDYIRTVENELTKAEAAAILAIVEQQVGRVSMAAALSGPVLNLSDALYRVGVVEVGKSLSVDIVFGRPDLQAISAIQKSNLFWVGNSWDSVTRGKFKKILTKYFEGGYDRAKLAKEFAEDFGQIKQAGDAYWDMLADHTATKTREIGRVSGYEQTGIEIVKIRAHIDDRTTQICIDLNGKIVSVKRLRKQVDDYFKAADKDDQEGMKEAWPMHKEGFVVPDGEMAPEGIGSPPYHFRCRTITVAEFRKTQRTQKEQKEYKIGMIKYNRYVYLLTKWERIKLFFGV